MAQSVPEKPQLGKREKNKQLLSIYYLPDIMLDALTHIDMFNPHKNFFKKLKYKSHKDCLW